MKTLVIYDEQGKVVFANTNTDINEGEFNPLVVTVPEGKMIIGVNIETGEPIFADIPKSEVSELKEMLAQQEEMTAELEMALMELANLVTGGEGE